MTFEHGAHQLVGIAFESSAPEPDAGFERRVLTALVTAETGRGAPRPSKRRWLPGGLPSRTAMILVAACMVVAVGATSALAAAGAFGSGGASILASMGLRGAAEGGQRVEASATDAGMTVRATAAYRDHHVVVVGVHVDGIPNDRVAFSAPGAPQPTAATSSGDQLQLWGGGASADGQVLVLARPDFSEFGGADVTLTLHSIVRYGPGSGPGVPAGTATTRGTWVMRFSVPVQGAPTRPVSPPAGGDLDGVHIAFRGVAGSGDYLFVEEDVSDVVPGSLGRALQTVPTDRRPTSDPLWLSVYDASGQDVRTLLQVSDVPGGKGGPAGPLTGPFHFTYVFTLGGPGTYRLVVHGANGDQLIRTVQIR